jgi:dTDP-4-amino-4,6-dideoxy-D-galactose acyltransferase
MNNCMVQSYTPDTWEHVQPVVAAWPFLPWVHHKTIPTADLVQFSCERVRNVLNGANGSAWIVQQKNHVRGFLRFSMLPWDSERLDTTAARIDYLVAAGSYREQCLIKQSLLDEAQVEIQRRGVRHLSIRIDASDLSSLHVLEKAGFITVDAILTFALDLSPQKPLTWAGDFTVRLANAGDAEQAAALAQTAYLYDRFHSDPFISRAQADQLHAVWLDNSCTGKTADAVIVAEDPTGLLGFVTCSLQPDSAARLGRKIGSIVLVAVAERARGLGVGHATTMAALEWFRQQDCDLVEVGTQLRNIAASRLYQKCGFRMVGSSISLRRLL